MAPVLLSSRRDGDGLPAVARVLLPEAAAPRLTHLRRWLGATLALYGAALQLATALGDATWAWPVHPAAAWSAPPGALLYAALRAVPFGYFAAFAARSNRSVLGAALASAFLTVAFELVDALPAPTVHVAAVLAGAAGALAGGAAFLRLARHLRARAENDAALLAPELPLVGGVYLATPLLWLAADAEAQSGDAWRLPWCLPLLGLYGCSLLASVRASRGSAGGSPARHVAPPTLWFIVGAAPLIPTRPELVLATAAGIALFAVAHPVLLGVRGFERRLERPALGRALPFLAIYLTIACLSVPAAARAGRSGAWIGWAAVSGIATPAGWGELVAAFAVVGYSLAELRGRREERAEAAWRAIRGPAAAIALAAAVMRAWPPGDGRWAAPFLAQVGLAGALAVGAARLGAGIYAIQRAHARGHATTAGMASPTRSPGARDSDPEPLRRSA